MQSTEPHYFWFLLLNPEFVLEIPPVEMLNPVYQILQSLRCKIGPHLREETVEKTVGKIF